MNLKMDFSSVERNSKPIKKQPVYYLILAFRNEKLYSRYYKSIDGNKSFTNLSPSTKKIVVIRARINTKNCRPKVKESESSSSIAWRRKSGPKSKHRRSSTPPTTRPTLLLPPMRCTEGAQDATTTAPVITTRVQRSSEPDAAYLTLDTQSIHQPSAPSPGHLFYNSEDHSDITFIVGQEEWRFPAHSFILAKSEPTLAALLRAAQGPEEIPPAAGAPPIILKLPNFQPEVFEQILRYIYTGQVTLLTIDSTLRLLPPSRLYHLPSLTSHCLGHLSAHLSPGNVLLILRHLLCGAPSPQDQPHDCENERNELLHKCFTLIDRHADAVLAGELFETLEHELVAEIVKRDTLAVASEASVFEAVMRWACRECKKRRLELTPENKCAVLGKALFLVRYLTMTPEEFLRGPVSHGVLSKEDKEAFLAALASNAPNPLLPERWSGWKIAEKRQRVLSPDSDTDLAVSPSNNSIQPLKRKKKSMSKKLLNGVGDLVICVIQLLD